MNTFLIRGRIVYSVIALIALLLFANFALIYNNATVIEYNKSRQDETELIKLNTVEMIRTLHLLDIGLRGYALEPKNPRIVVPYDTAVRRKNRILQQLETHLRHQHYTMNEFYMFKVNVDDYYAFAAQMKDRLDQNDHAGFMKIFEEDHGFMLQKSYRVFATSVNAFEDDIAQQANAEYERALRFSYWLQGLVLLLAVPTLLYLGFFAMKTFRLALQLHSAEAEKAQILLDQNQNLEIQVQLRTQELQAMNEEITTQNEEIMTSNEQLVLQREQIVQTHLLLQEQHEALKKAQSTIEEQNTLIRQHNLDLVQEVDSQTQYLMRANAGLKERNERLEQYAYVISHNLRGPLSRIQGLSSILDFATTTDEVKDIAQKMSTSTKDLDRVIKDLTMILAVSNAGTQILSTVDIKEIVDRVLNTLQPEIAQQQAELHVDLKVITMLSIATSIESIFHNLILNAIQYASSERPLVIDVLSYSRDRQIIFEVRDNGLGIDLSLYGANLFVPYKRFHYHVEGRGLGLYLVKTQIENLNGKMEVESTVGQGSLFRVLFPFSASS